MDRKQFFFKQQVTHQQLNSAFDGPENADRAAVVDESYSGVRSGLAVTAHSPNNLTVDVVGPGIAYDKAGQRVNIPSTQNVDCSKDYLGVSTSVVGSSNSKILSIFAVFVRNEATPLTDGNGNTIEFDETEGFQIKVVQGAEAASPVAPGVDATAILLADVTIAFGTSSITGGMISTTGRREDTFVATQSPIAIRRGKVKDAIADLVTFLGQHISGSGSRQAASTIDYGGGVAWADGTTNPAADVETTIDSIFSNLASTSGAGANKIGVAARTAWLGGRTNPATNIGVALDKIPVDLAAQTTSDDGAERIGAEAGAGYTVGSVRSQLDQIGPSATTTYSGAKTFDNITASGTNKYKLASRSITRAVSALPNLDSYSSWAWNNPGGAGDYTLTQTTTYATNQRLLWAIPIPNGAVITNVTVYVKGASGHASLPATMPIVSLEFGAPNTVGGGVSASQTDTSGSTAAYQAVHAISCTCNVTVDKSQYIYFIRFLGEGGANFVTGLAVYGALVTYTTTSMDDGGSV